MAIFDAYNVHPHFHIMVADGVFAKQEHILKFLPATLTQADIKRTEGLICSHVLHYLQKKKILTSDEVGKMLAKENTGFSLDGSVSISPWDRSGLERVLRYCSRPSFASENIKWNGKRVTYNLSKPTHRGQRSIQLDPIEFIDRIATLIPIPHRHRRHYFGVFAPNSPLRKQVVANAGRLPENFVPPPLRLQSEKVYRVSLEWAALIARIYEANPLICSACGGKIKIIRFVTYPAEILRILRGIGWPLQSHEFDPLDDFPEWTINQLLPDTPDGFPEMKSQENEYWWEEKPSIRDSRAESDDEPTYWHLQENYCDPPHEEVYVDPPH